MKASFRWTQFAALFAAAVLFGCQPAADKGGEKEAPPAAEGDAGEGEGDEVSSIEFDETILASMSEEDQALVRAQKTCPVGGADHVLTGMGEPVAVEHDGEKFFLCCADCKPAFEADPAKFAAIAHGHEDHGHDHDEGEAHDHGDEDHGDHDH